MHGLPLAIGRWARRATAGGPELRRSGQTEFIEATFAEAENASEFRLEFRNPGWYLVTVQCDTVRDTTEIELLDTTAEAINPLGRWRKADFVQVNSITASATGTADPTFTTLNRVWQPHEDVSISWTIKTTTVNQRVRFRVQNGTVASNRNYEIIVWRLFDWSGDNIAPANCLAAPGVDLTGTVAATLLTPTTNPWFEPRPQRYRVTCSANGATNRVRWQLGDALTPPVIFANATAADYAHQLRIKTQTTPPSTVTGDVTLRIMAGATVIHSATLGYTPTETETVVSIARRSGGDRITAIELTDITTADVFDVEPVLNVTD